MPIIDLKNLLLNSSEIIKKIAQKIYGRFKLCTERKNKQI